MAVIKKNTFTKRGKANHSRKLWANVAIVDGTDNGVPFSVYMKQLGAAKDLAYKTNGIVTDLKTGQRLKYVAGEWREVTG